jgi:hypothetical protein
LEQSTSKKQLKFFKFEEKILARLSVLMTVFHVFDSNSFFVVVRQHIESKKHKIKDRRKIEKIIFAMLSELVKNFLFLRSASSGYHI